MKLARKFIIGFTSTSVTTVAAQAQATLYRIGDLSGGKTYSEVRDATTARGVLSSGMSSNATAMPDNGTVLYGSVGYTGGSGQTQLVRYTNSASGASAISFGVGPNPGDMDSAPVKFPDA